MFKTCAAKLELHKFWEQDIKPIQNMLVSSQNNNTLSYCAFLLEYTDTRIC